LRKDAQPMHAHGREAAGGLAYARHRPEETQLYRLVEQHYPALVTHLAEQGKQLPAYVEKEFEAYLRCGRLEHGCMRHIRVPHPFGATLRSWQFGSPAELSCVCAVSPATSSACWPSVASAEDFARVAAPAG
jgi:hypothetical protein